MRTRSSAVVLLVAFLRTRCGHERIARPSATRCDRFWRWDSHGPCKVRGRPQPRRIPPGRCVLLLSRASKTPSARSSRLTADPTRVGCFLPTRQPLGSLEGSPGSDAVKRAGIEHVVDWSELTTFLERNATAAASLYYPAIGFSLPDLPPNITGGPPNAPLWAAALAKNWPSFQLKEVGKQVNTLMDVQSSSELINVRAAAKASVQAVMAGIRAIRPGVSQRSVEAAVEDACWKEEAHGASFWPWAMAGPNGVFP
jgi:hypothetical protein